MPDTTQLVLFIGAATVLLFIPGPAVIYIVARSIGQGRRAGMVANLGISAGTMFHVAAAALGLSVLLASSVTAFNIMRYAGALYLVYLGVREFFTNAEDDKSDPEKNTGLKGIFFESMIVNLFNPKLALFMFAFLPQFVSPSGGNAAIQITVLGALLIVLGLFSNSVYVFLAGGVRTWMSEKGRVLAGKKYLTGTVYLALGMITAFSGGRK